MSGPMFTLEQVRQIAREYGKQRAEDTLSRGQLVVDGCGCVNSWGSIVVEPPERLDLELDLIIEHVRRPEKVIPKYPEAKYTVVVQMPRGPGRLPVMAFVLPSGNLSLATFEELREAAAKGGCPIAMFTVGDSGVEHVKHELMHYGATKLD